MKKYLYLSQAFHVENWVNGGEVPLFLASSYRSQERQGIFTPDENYVCNIPADLRGMGSNVSFRNDKISRLTIDGEVVATNLVNFNRYEEDGAVLCLANRLSKGISRKLNKVACVEIQDVEELKNIIDETVGVRGEMGECNYTDTYERNHFLKSVSDAWQDEYRLFWKVKEDIKVTLPKGIAKFIWFDYGYRQ